ncbi:MAG: flagellar export protein FliJ [Candidatus Eisenbacteria bacterium]|nr:flagellar export protein FliJ [Candidatus Eisenbacteria bacterium]
MTKFRFRLQKVMNVKQCIEDRKKQDLAVAERTLEREERALSSLHDLEEECRRAVLEQRTGRIDIAWEEVHRARFDRLMRDICRQIEAVEHSRRRVSREREELVECSKERKTLEKLRENNLIEHMREWLRSEQKETDEIGRDTYLRKPKKELC